MNDYDMFEDFFEDDDLLECEPLNIDSNAPMIIRPEYILGNLFDKFKELEQWIYKDFGLGLQKIIEERLDEFAEPISQIEIDNFYKNLEILKQTSYPKYLINRKMDYRLSGGIENEKYVKDNQGKYSYLNKLNTNYSGLAELLSDLINMIYEKNIINDFDIDKVIQTINYDIKEGLLIMKKDLRNIIKIYFPTLSDFDKYTKHIIDSTECGDRVENRGINFLKSKELEIFYHGFNGDRIDMIFGVDLIVYNHYWGFKTVQVKSSKKYATWNNNYVGVDWMIYQERGELVVADRNGKIEF